MTELKEHQCDICHRVNQSVICPEQVDFQICMQRGMNDPSIAPGQL